MSDLTLSRQPLIQNKKSLKSFFSFQSYKLCACYKAPINCSYKIPWGGELKRQFFNKGSETERPIHYQKSY